MKPVIHRGISLVMLLITSLACNVSYSTSTQPTDLPPDQGGPPPESGDASLLFQDDFSSGSGNWGKTWGSSEGNSMGYADSGYRILVNSTQFILWGGSGNDFEGDVVIEVDAVKRGGAPDGYFGVICRDEIVGEGEHFYFLIFDGNGSASINKFIENSGTTLTYAQTDTIAALNEGGTVHIRAECIGNTLSLYVNDLQLVTVTDDSFTAGDAGLIAGTVDTPGTDVVFDNFLVRRP